MATWDPLDNDDLGVDKILTTGTMNGLLGNAIVAGQDINDATTTYNSGSGTYSKPAGYDDNDTILVRVWGGGGGGSAAPGAGGGGGFNQRAFRYADFPSSASYTVGAGGATNNAGGDSYVTGTGVDVAATGGKSNGGAYAGGKPAFRYGTSTSYEFDFSPYNGGNGGEPGSLVLGAAIWGGAGGVAAVTATQSKSIHGGYGGGNDGTSLAPTAPGGGGTTYTTGAGAGGRVQFIVIRGWHSTVMSDNTV